MRKIRAPAKQWRNCIWQKNYLNFYLYRDINVAHFHNINAQYWDKSVAQGVLHQISGHLVPGVHNLHIQLVTGIRLCQHNFTTEVRIMLCFGRPLVSHSPQLFSFFSKKMVMRMPFESAIFYVLYSAKLRQMPSSTIFVAIIYVVILRQMDFSINCNKFEQNPILLRRMGQQWHSISPKQFTEGPFNAIFTEFAMTAMKNTILNLFFFVKECHRSIFKN